MKFKSRLIEPDKTNKYYIKSGKGGYNKAMEIDKKTHSCLPNCCGLVHGRWLESQNTIDTTKDLLSTGNAENYYNHKDNYKRGNVPKIGSIICFRKGKADYSKDGAGHVAFVEEVKTNGDIIISNSAYKGKRFFLKTLKKKNNYKYGSGYTLQGFIYNPSNFDTKEEIYHKVVKGDSLWKLAKKYYGSGTKYTIIAKLNNIKIPYIIKLGQIIRIK